MEQTIYQFEMKNLAGQVVDLAEYKGFVLLIVNTASKCGFTPQLEDLEKLYQKYKDQNFAVLAFPSNNFGGQEPLEGEAIEEFCQVNYGVSFPVFEKSNVRGKEANDLYKFLSDKSANGKVGSAPKWNFYKYLVGRDGKVIDSYGAVTKPMSGKISKKIESLLTD